MAISGDQPSAILSGRPVHKTFASVELDGCIVLQPPAHSEQVYSLSPQEEADFIECPSPLTLCHSFLAGRGRIILLERYARSLLL